MITQIVFKIDEKVKKAAQARAKREGIALSDFFQLAARSFVRGSLDIGLIQEPEVPNARTARELRQIDRDIKMGRNLSPRFTNAKDAIAYLKKYAGD